MTTAAQQTFLIVGAGLAGAKRPKLKPSAL